jgi:hypothetical protein
MKLILKRTEFTEDSTIGEITIDGVHQCWTLEDKVRPDGVKVYGETAIPYGSYKITIAAFRGDTSKMYPLLLDVPMFTGICIHGGNFAKDTLGCILVGTDKAKNCISGAKEALYPLRDKIKAALDKNEVVWIEVTK